LINIIITLNRFNLLRTKLNFLRKIYKDVFERDPHVLREDFCGTFALCCEWVKLGPLYRSVGIDRDREPLEYGGAHYKSNLSLEASQRVSIIQDDVLVIQKPKADIICALNFSYCIFKAREHLKSYFRNSLKSLKTSGVFVLDLFGGSQCYDANEEETEHEDKMFTYFWDQASFNPLTNEAMFYIHFKRKGEKKREKVFSYDWRLWSIAEIQELLKEVGFHDVLVYWEGTDKNGEGSGIFKKTKKGEACEAWVAYIIGVRR
jgi:hypothetical protein